MNIKASKKQYPTTNYKIFVAGNDFADTFAAGYSLKSTYYGGSGANNFMANSGFDGVSLTIRWSAIETALGVYDFTGVDKYIQQVRDISATKPIALSIVYTASGGGVAPHIPSYILADEVTYGGYAGGHGGSVQSRSSLNYSGVRWHNANVYARWQLFINALATKYKSSIAYLFMDEFWSDVSYDITGGRTDELAAAGGGNHSAGIALIEGLQTAWVTYAANAFSPCDVFCKYNYLGGCEEQTPIYAAKNNGLNFCAELALPSPYDYRYPKPKKTSISFVTITDNIEIGRTFPSTSKRLVMSEWTGTSTYGDFTVEDLTLALKYAAYALEGAPNGGIYQMTCCDGVGSPDGTGSGLWLSAAKEMVNNRAFR